MSRVFINENGKWLSCNARAVYKKENGQWVNKNWDQLKTCNYRFQMRPAPPKPIGYVSFGDSIAAGHTIDAYWDQNYGERSQHGYKYPDGSIRTEPTVIVPGCYTDLIQKELTDIYGAMHVTASSFARSGDQVADLVAKLDQPEVRSALSEADLVTICIGANDVLTPALMALEEYITTGSLTAAESKIASNMAVLMDDSSPRSYVGLFNKLLQVNPQAKYILTTIYNPYKYLHLKEGHYGFFEPLMNSIPEIKIDVDAAVEDFFGIDDLGYWDALKWKWVSIELEANISSLIKDGLLGTPVVQQLFSRVNGLADWAENYVNQLNAIIRSKVSAYQTTSPNFTVAETKAIFDLFPDKTDSASDVDYSDLVNVEFTRNFDVGKADWGALWRGSNASSFWGDLVWKHISFNNAFPSVNPFDYYTFHLEEFAAELVQLIIEKVILPDVDPHPESDGHAVLKRSFTNTYGLTQYSLNGGEGAPGDAVLAQRNQSLSVPARLGYSFSGWCADPGLQIPLNLENLTDFQDSHVLADLVAGGSVKPKVPKITQAYAAWSANE